MALARATSAAFFVSSLTCGGCLLFTDEINEPPRVTAILPAAPRELTRDQSVELSAEVRDDRDPVDRITVEWTQTPGRCADGSAAGAPPPPVRGPKYRLVLPQQRELCVRVVAIDSHGARSQEHREDFSIDNSPPTARLEMRARTWRDGKVKLHSTVELTGEGSRDLDSDPLTYLFEVTLPDGSRIGPARCIQSPDDDRRRCLPATAPGRYQASLRVVDDGELESDAEPLLFEVAEDRPPCLEQTDPLLLQPLVLVPRGTRRTFEVRQVTDDGAPYPPEPGRPAETIFVWSKGGPADGPLLRIAGSAPTLDVSEALFDNPRPGDQFRIRVEVRDKLVDERMQQRLLPPPCPEAQELCVVDQCRRWVTWKVQFYP